MPANGRWVLIRRLKFNLGTRWGVRARAALSLGMNSSTMKYLALQH